MNYLQDRKNKKRPIWIILIIATVLFVVFFFYNSFFKGFSYSIAYISQPFLNLSHNINSGLNNIKSYFISKKSLQKENEDLRFRLNDSEARMTNYNTVLDENIKLKEDWGRKIEYKNTILATILAKPNKSLYDTLLIDIGESSGLKNDALVFAHGYVPVGRISEVNDSTSKVVLFSTSGVKTEVVISGQDSIIEILGRGGGNFEMIIPRDFELVNGTEVHLPGLTPYTVAKVETIISDPRDSLKKALLTSPVNIQNLKFVQIETQK